MYALHFHFSARGKKVKKKIFGILEATKRQVEEKRNKCTHIFITFGPFLKRMAAPLDCCWLRVRYAFLGSATFFGISQNEFEAIHLSEVFAVEFNRGTKEIQFMLELKKYEREKGVWEGQNTIARKVLPS